MKNTINLKDFLDYKYISMACYAPDGKHVAYLVSEGDEKHNEYHSYIYVWDGHQHLQLTSTGKEGIFFWQDDDTIIFQSIRTQADQQLISDGEELSVFYTINIHGGEAREAFRIPLRVSAIKQVKQGRYVLTAAYHLLYSYRYTLEEEERVNVIQQQKEMDDYEVLDEMPFYENGVGYTNKIRNSLFYFDVNKQELKRMSDELYDVAGFEIGENHVYYFGECFHTTKEYKESICRYTFDGFKNDIIVAKGSYSIVDIQPWDDRLLVLASDNGHYGINENAQFYMWKEADKQLELLAAYDDSIGSSVGSDVRYGGSSYKALSTNGFYFITTKGYSSHIYRLQKDGEIEAIWEGNGSVDGLAVHDDNLCYIGLEVGKLQELYTLDVQKNTQRQISTFHESIINNKDIRPLTACHIEQDGLAIHGWVMLPREYDETKTYPAILDIHGGPKTVYGEVYYHEMQVWANLGYFVFFMNPRGGDGRGNAFADIRGKYGTIDYEDLMKFTDTVLEQYPAIDKKRVGVTGGSYGGFMTNWIITHTDRFACAVSQRSIANWVSFAYTSDIHEFFANDQQAADTFMNVEKMWWHSPLKYADQCTTPTLFIHSNEDYRCPYSEGMQMYSALRLKGVTTRLVMFKGENHELSRSGKPKHRVKRLEEITSWMDRYLKS